MLKTEYFKSAMKAGLYKKLDWCIRAFSIISEAEDEWKKEAYAGRIVQHHTGYYIVNEELELVKIEDGVVGQPLYTFAEHLTIDKGDVPNVQETMETSYGNLLWNWIVIAWPFGHKLPYQTGQVKNGKVADMIINKLEDDPKPGMPLDDDVIYVSEYLKYTQSLDYLRSFTQLCVVAATRKTMLPPPGIKEYRDKLVAENKDSLDDLATIAKIDKALVEYDAEWLKGDPGELFLGDGGKSRDVVRKKKFLMHGAEVGMQSNAVKGVLVENSLYEGWDITKFPEMNTSSRSGSFARGAQTQLGGVSVKWLLRASSNLQITKDDCGSMLGSEFLIDKEEVQKLIGKTIIVGSNQTLIKDENQAGTYLGKKVVVRNPQYCMLDHTDYCKICLGKRLSINPNGLSTSVSDLGSKMMLISMSAMHGKKLSTEKIDLSLAFT